MKTEKQILATIPTATSCKNAEDAEFGIFKLKRELNELPSASRRHYPSLYKRLDTLHAKADKYNLVRVR